MERRHHESSPWGWWCYWRTKRRRECSQQRQARLFLATGDLYAGLEADEVEKQGIRAELEEHGIPMGYGRVWQTPIQLEDVEARAQFALRNARGRNREPNDEDKDEW